VEREPHASANVSLLPTLTAAVAADSAPTACFLAPHLVGRREKADKCRGASTKSPWFLV